jgi:NADH-quinone oxidoreductase subunit N
VTLLAFVYSSAYLRNRNLWVGEYYVLMLFALLGIMIMISANGFLTLYLGLELLALCLYALVAFDRDSKVGAEAAMKYFVLGALGSGMLLYGISMLYGATGGLSFSAVSEVVSAEGVQNKILVFGLVFVIIGIAFKFGAVPFHMWMPDVYQGAPTPVVLFLSSAPKIAAFAMAARILIDALSGLQGDWSEILIIMSVLSMGIGNLVAIAQTNIKRMLAYSTISHVGFIFLGLLAGTATGYAAAMFYAVVYALMAAGAFGVLVMISHKGFEAENLDDLKGLGDRDPWLAAMMTLVMFSMAGVPPMVGFMAKLLVLEAVIDIGLVWLALVAVAFSIIGAFYYLRVVKMIYFDKAEVTAPVDASGGARLAVTANGLAMLVLGMFPAMLLALCEAAFL